MRKINVTIWNEYCHEKLDENIVKIYPEGIHGAIKQKLSPSGKFSIRAATWDMEDHGLSDEVLDNTDVLLWWGHMKHADVKDEIANEIGYKTAQHFSVIFKKSTGLTPSAYQAKHKHI